MSRSYGRMSFEATEPCECYLSSSASRAAESGGSRTADSAGSPHSGTVCYECHYWLPSVLMPRVGRCDNPSSRHYGRPAFSDKPTESCFAERSLEGLDFVWCETHRRTVYSAELSEHRGCRVFVSSATLPVEEEMELTLAGD